MTGLSRCGNWDNEVKPLVRTAGLSAIAIASDLGLIALNKSAIKGGVG
jgi:hypothetical protein